MQAKLSAPEPAVLPRERGLSLRRNVSWTTAGNLIYALCQWGVLAVIARTGTPAMVGIFALGLAITAPVIQLANLQLRGIQATDARGEHPFADYLTLRLATTAMALLACAGIAIVGNRARETVAVILLIALAKAVDAVSDVFYGHFQHRERMDVIARAQAANGALSLLLVAAGMAATGSLVAGVAGYLIGSALPLVAYTVPAALRSLARDGQLRLVSRDPGALRRLAWTALPLGVVMLLISLNANIPRYVIEHERGSADLGIFAALAYLLVAGGLVVTAVGQAISPRLARQHAAGDAAGFRRSVTRMIAAGLALGAVAAVAAWAVGAPVVALLYTDAYAGDTGLLVLLALAAGVTFAASFAGFAMTAARRFRAQVPVFLATVATCAVASLALIPAAGLRGAAVALLASAAVQLGCSLVVVRRALAAGGAA
jgi:O-antigen/teichoic acid export membrane protein